MKSDEPKGTYERGGRAKRVLWPPYDPRERELLQRKFFGDWESLGFMSRFWEPVYDERDTLQWRMLAEAWRLSRNGMQYSDIDSKLGWTYGTARALVVGSNRHPNLAVADQSCRSLWRPLRI